MAVTIGMVNEWRKKNAARQAEAGIKLPEITKLYDHDFTAKDVETRSWQLLEKELALIGFSEFFLEKDGRFMTKYGDITCRVFLQHKELVREYTVVSLLTNQVVDAGQFQVTEVMPKAKPGAKAGTTSKLVYKQLAFTVANLLLPQKNNAT